MRSALAASAFLLAVSFVAGCGGDEGNGTATGANPEPASFAGVPWKLVSGVDVEGFEASPPSATFENGVVGGSTGCNHYSAPVTIDGDSMKIGMIAATQMACAPPADSVERAYLDALGQVDGWRMDGSALVLVNGDGDELLRYEAASPVGDWEATSIQTGDALASPLPGTTITAKFADDGTLSGSAGCNSYTTSYTLDGGEIEIAPPAATRKACAAPDGVMEQEAAYLAALPKRDALQGRRRRTGAPSGRRHVRRVLRARRNVTLSVAFQAFASRGRWVSCSHEHVESMDRAKALAQGAHLTRQAPSPRRTARPRGAACTPVAGVSPLE